MTQANLFFNKYIWDLCSFVVVIVPALFGRMVLIWIVSFNYQIVISGEDFVSWGSELQNGL